MGNQGNTTSDPEKNELPTPNPILGENLSHEWKGAKISQMKENQERLSPADRPWKNGSSSSLNRKKKKNYEGTLAYQEGRQCSEQNRGQTPQTPFLLLGLRNYIWRLQQKYNSLWRAAQSMRDAIEAMLCVINRGDKGLYLIHYRWIKMES